MNTPPAYRLEKQEGDNRTPSTAKNDGYRTRLANLPVGSGRIHPELQKGVDVVRRVIG